MSFMGFGKSLFLARTAEVGVKALVHTGAAGNIDHWKKSDRVDGGLDVQGKYLSDCFIREPSDIVIGTGKVAGVKVKELQDKIWAELNDRSLCV